MALAAVTDTTNSAPFQQEFEHFIAQQRNEPDYIKQLRQHGWQQFQHAGFPHQRLEPWRATDLSQLANKVNSLQLAPETLVDAAVLPPALTAESIRLVFINGRFSASLSQQAALPDGVIIASLAGLLKQPPACLEKYLGQLPGLQEHAFTALNTTFFSDGAAIYIPAGCVIEQPVQLVFYSSGDDTINYPRNIVVVERAAQVTVVEEYLGQGDYCVCPVTELYLADAAICRHHTLQLEAAQAYHLGGWRSRQQRDSCLEAHFLNSQGMVNRCDIHAELDGPGADCQLSGLTLVNDGQLGDYHVQVKHKQPHGTSQQVFKAILDGKARAVFDGLIKVVKDAQKTDASQDSRSLLLSKRALAHTNPRLEILADDVKCAHGSTIGFLDQQALFYLRSRGIPAAQARALLVYAFANAQLEALSVPALRERLQNLLLGHLAPTVL